MWYTVRNSDIPLRLNELTVMYQDLLAEMKSPCQHRYIHSTRFKECLLKHLGSDYFAQGSGKWMYISCNQDLGQLCTIALNMMDPQESTKIVEVALIIRKYALRNVQVNI